MVGVQGVSAAVQQPVLRLPGRLAHYDSNVAPTIESSSRSRPVRWVGLRHAEGTAEGGIAYRWTDGVGRVGRTDAFIMAGVGT